MRRCFMTRFFSYEKIKMFHNCISSLTGAKKTLKTELSHFLKGDYDGNTNKKQIRY